MIKNLGKDIFTCYGKFSNETILKLKEIFSKLIEISRNPIDETKNDSNFSPNISDSKSISKQLEKITLSISNLD